MPLPIAVGTATGADLFATLERLDNNFFWNQTAGAWQSAPAEADRKIDLTEGSGINAGSYTASVSGLGDAGVVRVRVHDDADAADAVVSGGQVYVRGGEEVGGPELVATEAAVAALNDLSAADVWAHATRTLSAGAVTAATFAADAIDAAALAADAVAEVQAGLATAAALAAVDDFIDTEVSAIKAKTDQLTFTVANRVDSTTQAGVSTLDAAGVRAAVGLASANLDTQIGDLPTAAETATAVWAAGTRTLTAGTNIQLPTDGLANVTAWTVDLTGDLSGSVGSVAAGGITEASIATPAEAAGRPTGILGMMRRLFEGRHNKRVRNRTTGVLQVRNAADTADLETATQSTVGATDTQTAGA